MLRPATINKLEIQGARNTRSSFLDPLVKPLVDDRQNAGTTLGDVTESIQTLVQKLERFGAFDSSPSRYGPSSERYLG
jgi:outer membrane protein insertion porin family